MYRGGTDGIKVYYYVPCGSHWNRMTVSGLNMNSLCPN